MTWVDGEVLVPGRLLSAPVGCRRDVVPSASPYQPEFGIEELLDRQDLDLYTEIADRNRAVFTTLDSVGDSFGTIQADYDLGSCFMQRAGSQWRASVFDFDDCGWGYFLYDLCPLLGNRNANHRLLTARHDVSPTPTQDATWRMNLARQCLDPPHRSDRVIERTAESADPTGDPGRRVLAGV
ncbi:hypothetical protein ACIBG5_42095 [Kribbella sp. NPDC050241]|uniref:hypothetical protein n=1 Tax=Kribbella sp. NPDC050241 TaxID=3364115 RepID=UPI0037ACD4D4